LSRSPASYIGGESFADEISEVVGQYVGDVGAAVSSSGALQSAVADEDYQTVDDRPADQGQRRDA
jgi:hypothetical protein